MQVKCILLTEDLSTQKENVKPGKVTLIFQVKQSVTQKKRLVFFFTSKAGSGVV